MNKALLVTVAAMIIGVIGFTAYSLNGPEASTTTTQDSVASEPSNDAPISEDKDAGTTTTDSDSDTSTTVNGKYIDYSPNAINSSNGTKLLFFHAPWCSQCRAIESDINSQGIPDDTTVIKVDYDSSQDLRKKYNVTLQTTFVKVDNNGNEIEKYVAYDQPTFDSVKANLL